MKHPHPKCDVCTMTHDYAKGLVLMIIDLYGAILEDKLPRQDDIEKAVATNAAFSKFLFPAGCFPSASMKSVIHEGEPKVRLEGDMYEIINEARKMLGIDKPSPRCSRP